MASVIGERARGLAFVDGGLCEGFARRPTVFVNRACFAATLNYRELRQTADKEIADLMTSFLVQKMSIVKVHYFIIWAEPIELPPLSTQKQCLSVCYNMSELQVKNECVCVASTTFVGIDELLLSNSWSAVSLSTSSHFAHPLLELNEVNKYSHDTSVMFCFLPPPDAQTSLSSLRC